jgi:hypothetical protein
MRENMISKNYFVSAHKVSKNLLFLASSQHCLPDNERGYVVTVAHRYL